MNRKLITKAISDIDDVFIEEAMLYPAENFGYPPERTSRMENRKVNSRRIIVLLLAACLIFTLAVTAYAADIGGIRRIIQIWLYGEQTTAELIAHDNNYTILDEDGSVIMSGGGIAIEEDGTERPLTEDEILKHLDQPDLVHHLDGSMWIYDHGYKIELTKDMFDEDGYCYLELRGGENILYVTIDKNGGMMTSLEDFPQPVALAKAYE